ncbi:CotH kinase family protein [Absicoccus porci]|uniref:CotH kinase family protein n=1 Tax=Absicoccus porci TaxID=2486576 RepID=UPI002943943F|nr:CotH kinase family protein [Absicoccus porci]
MKLNYKWGIRIIAIFTPILITSAAIQHVYAKDIDSSSNSDTTEISNSTTQEVSKPELTYRSHVQNDGWQEEKQESEMAGTTGESKRIEAISVGLENNTYQGNLEYRSQIQNKGWESNWTKADSVSSVNHYSGTQGEAKRLEAIQIRLTGELANHYNVLYRAHVQGYGWMNWVEDGQIAGTVGESRRLEGIIIMLRNKADVDPLPLNMQLLMNNGFIESQYILGKNYLFVPKSIDLKQGVLAYNGEMASASVGIVDNEKHQLTGSFENNSIISLEDTNHRKFHLHIMQSDLPSMIIELKDNLSLSTINNGSKDIKYEGNQVSIFGTNQNFSNNNVEIKGRGNYSWNRSPKKGYQIKFDKKVDLFGFGKAKKWVLIANYGDASLMRNKVAFDLAKSLGMKDTPDLQVIDLWVNGQYLGNYLLCEKVEISKNRVNLKAEDGILCEMDNNYYLEEDNWFQSDFSGGHFVLKESVANDEDQENSVGKQAFYSTFKNTIQTFESLLYANNKDWEKLAAMIDVDSFVKYYLIQEFCENPDATRSSMYLYKDGIDDKLHIGPVWDFDLALGNVKITAVGGNPQIDFLNTISEQDLHSISWFTELLKIPEFTNRILEIFEQYNNCFAQLEDCIDINSRTMSQSAQMNFDVWNEILGYPNNFGARGHAYKVSYAKEVEILKRFINQRLSYMQLRYTKSNSMLNYTSHIQNIGWQKKVHGMDISGTTGQSKRMEAIRIMLDTDNLAIPGSIEYRSHIQNIGWEKEWKKDGALSGTTGKGLRLEAIQIRLTNDLANIYDVFYRVHCQSYGWLDWTSNGKSAGTVGKFKAVEAIQIALIPKNKKLQ